jgi:hypothetical protein
MGIEGPHREKPKNLLGARLFRLSHRSTVHEGGHGSVRREQQSIPLGRGQAQPVFSSKGTSSWIMTPFGVLDVTAMRPSSWAIRLLITLKPRLARG